MSLEYVICASESNIMTVTLHLLRYVCLFWIILSNLIAPYLTLFHGAPLIDPEASRQNITCKG